LKSTTNLSNVSSITPLINKYGFEFYVYVEVEPEIYKNGFVLTDFEELGTDETYRYICLLQNVEYLGGPWYRIISLSLDTRPGHHIYRMHMVNKHTDDVVSVYFAYILQDDEPHKPYMYMDKNRLGACCCNVDSSNRVS